MLRATALIEIGTGDTLVLVVAVLCFSGDGALGAADVPECDALVLHLCPPASVPCRAGGCDFVRDCNPRYGTPFSEHNAMHGRIASDEGLVAHANFTSSPAKRYFPQEGQTAVVLRAVSAEMHRKSVADTAVDHEFYVLH